MIRRHLLINQINQQETLSKLKNCNTKGSSETERRITFQFDNFIIVKPKHKLTVDINFLTWFIGFIEGDGSFIVSHHKVYFDLTQDLKDINLLYKIKQTLGFGSILTRTDKHRNVGVYYITGKDNFIRLVNLFNGNLISNYKKNQFKTWLEVFNKQYNQQIQYIESNIEPTFNNSWLSGFIDAEGCFAARVKYCHTSKSGKNLFIDFSISQKQPHVLILIRNLFNIKTQTNLRYDPSWNGYCFFLSNKKLLIYLVKYLKNYPLKTKKHIDFLKL
jgi:LAGLIDADG endonuclease